MKIQRFVADSMQQALKEVADALGDNAVIVSNQRTSDGVEVVAALNYDASKQADIAAEVARQRQQHTAPDPIQANDVKNKDALRDTLEKLKRQRQPAPQNTLESGLQALVKPQPKPVAQVRQTPVKPKKPSTNAARASEDLSLLSSMSGELKDLKNWMVSQTGNRWDAQRPLTWQQAQLWQRCLDMGIETPWANKLVAKTDDQAPLEAQWRDVLDNMAADLAVATPPLLKQGGIVALVGPTGAGKTTTLSKLAAQCVMEHGAEAVALITLDNYRVAAHDQLRHVARILGAQCLAIPQGGDLGKVLSSLKKKRCILIDSAGLSVHDPHFSEQLSMLKNVPHAVQNLLVLPLTSQMRCLQESFQSYAPLSLAGCVLSKLDESFSLGSGMSLAALNRLPIAYVTDGPHTPDDIRRPDAEKLVHMAEQMARLQFAKDERVDAPQVSFS